MEVYVTTSVYYLVLQKSIPAQISQPFANISIKKRLLDGFVRELTLHNDIINTFCGIKVVPGECFRRSCGGRRPELASGGCAPSGPDQPSRSEIRESFGLRVSSLRRRGGERLHQRNALPVVLGDFRIQKFERVSGLEFRV